MSTHYTYTIDFHRPDGTHLGQTPVEPDWMPALEWIHFEGIRAGVLRPVMVANPAGSAFDVEPVWHPTAGRPRLSAFRVTVPAGTARAVSRLIPTAYLRGCVEQASAALVEQGALRCGEAFRYVVNAFASNARAARAPSADFAVEAIPQPLPLIATALKPFLSAAARPGREDVDGDAPVFIARAVLDQTTELARRAGDLETGGVLVGFLHHDPSIPEIFVEITAQIAALHTEAASTKLTFTPETWAAVRAALALRKRGEVMLGWWHYHPDFCRLRNCPLENRLHCTAASAFFSGEDVALHTALFARAYNTALLISDCAATGLGSSLFGWRQGMVSARGFYTIGGDTSRRQPHNEMAQRADFFETLSLRQPRSGRWPVLGLRSRRCR
jgi:proteasome lid subunit RPN8/RPN11